MTPAERERLSCWLALALAPGVGPRTVARLVELHGYAAVTGGPSRDQMRAAGLSGAALEPAMDALRQPDRAALDAALAWAEQDAATILTLDDPRYPPRLAALDAPPAVLYVRGDVGLLADPQLAMVGSRNPTAGGLETSRAFARHLAALGLTITSGMAIGIDGAAHAGALESGRTIAVLGTGPDRVYPAAHRALARGIAESGALVSEFPPGTGPHASHFPRRNRIISGLSLGTLVVEAAVGSGSLITARDAMEQGREVFAIPGSIHNPLARGCHALIRQGAKLVDSADQILEELQHQLRGFLSEPAAGAASGRGAGSEAAPADPDPADLDPDYRRLLDCIGFDPVSTDELIMRTGLPAQAVSSMLLLLELQGHVSSRPGGCYTLPGGR